MTEFRNQAAREVERAPKWRRVGAFLFIVALFTLTIAGFALLLQSHTTLSSPPSLTVGVRLNATSIQIGQHLEIQMWVNNTSDEENNVTAQDGWAPGLQRWGCAPLLWPLRLGLMYGSYTESNLSKGAWLPLSAANFNCSILTEARVESFLFEPSSSMAKVAYSLGNQTQTTTELEWEETVVVPGPMYESISRFGTYTVVVGDEWGHVALATFSVTA